MKLAYQEKLEFYEFAIEEITAENTRLVLQLDSVESLEKDKMGLEAEIVDINRQNRTLERDI